MTSAPIICKTIGRDDLIRRANGRCITWADQPLPDGCTPTAARMGFEYVAEGPARLLVDLGVEARGLPSEIDEWLATGTRQFPSVAELFRWVDDHLVPLYAPPGAAIPAHPTSIADLTDLDAVAAPVHDPVCYLEADQVIAAIKAEVIGQERAVSTMVRRVVEHAAQVRPVRPLTLFAIGPTGVGKTSAVHTLARVITDLTGAPMPFLRIDLSEYREAHRVSQLLGAPAGYIGHGRPTPLIEVLAAGGWCVVLFDEVDKAHPDVWTTLMNALDAGRITSGDGRAIDCRRAIFVFTSNRLAAETVDALPEGADERVTDQICRERFRAAGILPELIGRLRSFLVFVPLAPDALAQTAALSIRRTAEAYGLELAWIHPGVVSRVLDGTQRAGIGVRHLEYGATALLGTAFAGAARQGRAVRVQVDLTSDGTIAVEPFRPRPDTEPSSTSAVSPGQAGSPS